MNGMSETSWNKASAEEIAEQGQAVLHTLLESRYEPEAIAHYYDFLYSPQKSPTDLVRQMSDSLRDMYIHSLQPSPFLQLQDRYDFYEQEVMGLVFGRTASRSDAPVCLHQACQLLDFNTRLGSDEIKYQGAFWSGLVKLQRREAQHQKIYGRTGL